MGLTSFLNSLILLGSVQGFIIGTILYFSSKERPSGKLIAFLLLIFALACLKIYLNNIGFVNTQIGSLVDAYIPFMILMPVGPLIYFYCKAELYNYKIGPEDRKHFYSVAVDVFHHVCAIVFSFVIIFGWANPQKNSFGFWFDTYNVYSDIARWGSLIVYLIISYRLLKQAVKEAGLRSENVHHLPWLKEFVGVFAAFALLWTLYLVPYVIPRYTDTMLNAVDWYPVYLPLVAIIYWLGLRGFLIMRKEVNQLRKPPTLQLSDGALDQILGALHTAMTDSKLYLDTGLDLAALSKHVGAHPKIVSAVLNQKVGKTFNEYVNHFRVKEVKERLMKDESKKYTIVSLAYECGFSSQPTFQRAFKNAVGLTPREYLARQKGAPDYESK